MIITEYRILLPLTLEEYNKGQRYTIMDMNKSNTGGGEGIEYMENEPYTDEKSGETGQYTHLVYKFESRAPKLIRALAPSGSFDMFEKSWNSFPKRRTLLKNKYMGSRFTISTDTISLQDDGKSENAHNLTAEELSARKIVYIDFVNDSIPTRDYDANFDPGKIHFETDKVSRSPLGKNWLTDVKNSQLPVMCCYKVVKSNFALWPIQGQVERLIQSQLQRVFLIFHRTLYGHFDLWNQLSMDEIDKLEKEVQNSLVQVMSEGQTQGVQL